MMRVTRFKTRGKGRTTRYAASPRAVFFAPLSLALALVPGMAVGAQDAPKDDPALPALGKARALQLPQIVQQTLPNGLKIVLLEDHKQPAVWMRLALPAGAIRDPKDKVGLASMSAALLTKGTSTRSESQIADLVDGLGANLGASADSDFLTVSASGLSAYSDTLFGLLADVTLHPTFPDRELERTRLQTLNGLTAALAQPATIADAAMARIIFGAHPYGNFSTGTPTTLKSLTRDDLVKFHDTYFASNQATLFLAGDITPKQAMDKAQAAFGGWAQKDVPAAPAPPAAPGDSDKPQITIIDRPGAAQTEVRIGALANGYNDPNRIAATVSTAVLGLGQFEGRLTREIRVKRGLTYGAASFFRRNKDAGEFEISTYTKNASTAEVVRLALEEARKIGEGEVPSQELQDRKTFLQGTFAVSVATPAGVLNRLVPAVLYGNGPGDLTLYTDRVQAVTGSQVPEIMRGLHLNAPQIVLVGDAKAIQKDVEAIGTVRVIPLSSLDLQSPTLQGAGTGEAPTNNAGANNNAGNGGNGNASPAEMAEGKTRLAATIKAHGGEKFLNLKSIVLKGKGELTDPTGQLPGPVPIEKVTLTIAAPDKVRADLEAGFEISFGTPGGENGDWLTVQGAEQASPGGVSTALNPIKLLQDAYTKGYAVRSLPATGDSKETAYVITADKGMQVQVYADPVTHLASRIILPNKRGDATIYLGNYKATQGVQIPGKLKVVQGKMTFLDLDFSDIAVNTPVDNAIFAKPK